MCNKNVCWLCKNCFQRTERHNFSENLAAIHPSLSHHFECVCMCVCMCVCYLWALRLLYMWLFYVFCPVCYPSDVFGRACLSLWSPRWGRESWLRCISLTFSMRAVCRNQFTLPLGDIARLCSMTLAPLGHLIYFFYKYKLGYSMYSQTYAQWCYTCDDGSKQHTHKIHTHAVSTDKGNKLFRFRVDPFTWKSILSP